MKITQAEIDELNAKLERRKELSSMSLDLQSNLRKMHRDLEASGLAYAVKCLEVDLIEKGETEEAAKERSRRDCDKIFEEDDGGSVDLDLVYGD